MYEKKSRYPLSVHLLSVFFYVQFIYVVNIFKLCYNGTVVIPGANVFIYKISTIVIWGIR